MNLEQMINELNEYVENSLGITRFVDDWELSSYREKSLFGHGKYVEAQTFRGVVEKAYALMEEKKGGNNA